MIVDDDVSDVAIDDSDSKENRLDDVVVRPASALKCNRLCKDDDENRFNVDVAALEFMSMSSKLT